jgi:hypothetical protein
LLWAQAVHSCLDQWFPATTRLSYPLFSSARLALAASRLRTYMKEKIQVFIESTIVQRFIISLIVINAIILGMETSKPLMQS